MAHQKDDDEDRVPLLNFDIEEDHENDNYVTPHLGEQTEETKIV